MKHRSVVVPGSTQRSEMRLETLNIANSRQRGEGKRDITNKSATRDMRNVKQKSRRRNIFLKKNFQRQKPGERIKRFQVGILITKAHPRRRSVDTTIGEIKGKQL